jgi:hypothetical protein
MKMECGFYVLNGNGTTVYFSESFELMDDETSENPGIETVPYSEESYFTSYETARFDK